MGLLKIRLSGDKDGVKWGGDRVRVEVGCRDVVGCEMVVGVRVGWWREWVWEWNGGGVGVAVE